MSGIRIENWEIITLPWEKKHSLHGQVYGHPRVPDGNSVTTSILRDLREDTAVTNSGTVYLLGKRKEQPFNTDAATATKEFQCLSM